MVVLSMHSIFCSSIYGILSNLENAANELSVHIILQILDNVHFVIVCNFFRHIKFKLLDLLILVLLFSYSFFENVSTLGSVNCE